LKIAAICIVLAVFLSGCIFSGTEGSFQFSSPVIGKNGEVFVNTSDRIYSFTSGSDSGKSIFSFEPGEGEWFSCAPSVDSDGNLYIGTTNGRLLKISPEGDLNWSFGGNEIEGASAIRGSPSFDQSGNVLYGTYDGALYCLSSDGQELWSFDTGREIWSKPAVGRDGTIFFGTMVTAGQQSNRFYALKNGELLWIFETGATSSGFYSSPALGSDGTVYCSCHDGFLYALDPTDGTLKWELRLPEDGEGSSIASSPIVGEGDRLFVCTYDGVCSAINNEGEVIWSTNLQSEIVSTPVSCSNGVLYVIGRGEARMFQLDIADGTLERSDHIGSDSLGSPVMSQEGTLYYAVTLNDIGGRSRLGSLSTDSFPSGSWPMYGHDHNRSGRQEGF